MTDRFGSSGAKKNSFVAVFGVREKYGVQFVTKILLLFRIVVGRSNDSQGNSFLQYKDVTRSIHTVDKIHGFVCQW